MRLTPENIVELKPNQVFCFGSNTKGIHGKGAALQAKNCFGAKVGVGMGRTGQCYAIPTKDDDLKVLPPAAIKIQITEFIRYAKEHPDLEFLVTRIGCGLAGYSPIEIAPMFFRHGTLPTNIYLPIEFWNFQ